MAHKQKLDSFVKAVHDNSVVTGGTHDFYNYPARFSPQLAREAICTFTRPGDVILDPFMGGGTTLVEAKRTGRHAVGFDISSLSRFVATTKLTDAEDEEADRARVVADDLVTRLNCRIASDRPTGWIERGYQRNLSNRQTWAIRKLIEQAVTTIENHEVADSEPVAVTRLLRCALLKTGQWALDSTTRIPTTKAFKAKFIANIGLMCDGLKTVNGEVSKLRVHPRIECFNVPANGVAQVFPRTGFQAPKLVLTSPPYPGIHIVYHRWQIHGRRETPAPFWIANSQDGHGISHYTMGARKQAGLTQYFDSIRDAFSSVAKVCDAKTIVVQVLAFSDPSWQLPRYLQTMEEAGFRDLNEDDERIWRIVPNRKWYAQKRGVTSSSREVILFHRLKR